MTILRPIFRRGVARRRWAPRPQNFTKSFPYYYYSPIIIISLLLWAPVVPKADPPKKFALDPPPPPLNVLSRGEYSYLVNCGEPVRLVASSYCTLLRLPR